ncbi:hypothetical protein CDD81_2741 [Ophiocordyceps australis]|uniref:J domain-containing protein n=1 Tax=Ophiocordyceps australis TaxID=1399860 RepID=A0A2C5XAY5_9HYPO|nr:hypothetical protein CDD81_2741 [Ophiocordyceps australis]
MAPTRDYYADLELPPTADVQEVKKQFKKLALKYHPDRNPGREDEVNSKFQTIQSAHEILSDPQRKAKYDATLGRTGRFPGSSGVRGNPWEHVSQQFPTPPRRNATTRNATSGAQRWRDRFPTGVPPTARQHATADSEARKNADRARASEHMRRNQPQASAQAGHREAQPSQPPPPPPRTESAKQRAQASFGARKPGFHPRSAMTGDEPPVSNFNYSSRRTDAEEARPPPPPPRQPRHSQHSTKIPDPLSHFKDNAESRQSTPYASHGGEKTNPFDGVPSRAKSMKDAQRNEDVSSTEEKASAGRKARSFSVPKPPQDGRASMFNKPSYAEQQASVPASNSPYMYGIPCSRQQEYSNLACVSCGSLHLPFSNSSAESECPYGPSKSFDCIIDPSGTSSKLCGISVFEQHQRVFLDQLINNLQLHEHVSGRKRSRFEAFEFARKPPEGKQPSPTPDPAHMSKSSVDDINTQFSSQFCSDTWHFAAGNQEPGGPGTPSPVKQPFMTPTETAPPMGEMPAQASGFDANGWSDKFGPQTFVPQPTPGASISPTRPGRANSKKVRARPTVGTAAVVDDSSDDETYEWRGRNAQAKSATVDSVQPMDIDSPPPASAPPPQSLSPRKIPVEPSRPEWRSGNGSVRTAEEFHGKPETSPVNNTAGSEDSHEFRANMADLKNVPPFVDQNSGLESLTDLNENLPFESKASSHLKPSKVQFLGFPTPPEAPRLPPTAAVTGLRPNTASWMKYLADFEIYLRQWDEFNGRVVDHFATRKALIQVSRHTKGLSFLAARGDGEVQEYRNWVSQDNDVRRRWIAACEDHEKRLEELMSFREMMK